MYIKFVSRLMDRFMRRKKVHSRIKNFVFRKCLNVFLLKILPNDLTSLTTLIGTLEWKILNLKVLNLFLIIKGRGVWIKFSLGFIQTPSTSVNSRELKYCCLPRHSEKVRIGIFSSWALVLESVEKPGLFHRLEFEIGTGYDFVEFD
jgi:hypothetical protein